MRNTWNNYSILYNYIDGIMVTNERGYVEFYKNYRPNLNHLKESDVIHKHITEIYPDLTEESSSILRVLKTGKSISKISDAEKL